MENLKTIDDDILEKIKDIHLIFSQYKKNMKELFDAGAIDEAAMQQITDLEDSFEAKMKDIYANVMTEEEVHIHMKDLNKKLEKDFG